MSNSVPDPKIHGKGNSEFDIINFKDLSHVQVNTNLEKDKLTDIIIICYTILKLFIICLLYINDNLLSARSLYAHHISKRYYYTIYFLHGLIR